jgi:hypothetical protein
MKFLIALWQLNYVPGTGLVLVKRKADGSNPKYFLRVLNQ